VLLALNQPTRHFARPRYLVAVTTRRQRVLSIDFDKCNTVSTAGVSSFRWMPMMCYDLTVVSPHMHGASRRSASHNDMSVSRAVPNLTADTLVAQVVSRDSTCKLRHMPYSTLHCVGFPDPCVPLVHLLPRTPASYSPPTRRSQIPCPGNWNARDYSGQANAFPGVWLVQRAYMCSLQDNFCCGARFRSSPLVISCSCPCHGDGLEPIVP
jgi:hypothetical protein